MTFAVGQRVKTSADTNRWSLPKYQSQPGVVIGRWLNGPLYTVVMDDSTLHDRTTDGDTWCCAFEERDLVGAMYVIEEELPA